MKARSWCWGLGFVLACSSSDYDKAGPSSNFLDGTAGGTAGMSGSSGESGSGAAAGSAGGTSSSGSSGSTGTSGGTSGANAMGGSAGLSGQGGTAGTQGGVAGDGGQGGSGGVDVGICGDGFRREALEECDDGNSSDDDACADCHVQDVLAAGATMYDLPPPLGRRLGAGRHPLSGDSNGVSVSLLDDSSDPPHLTLARFSAQGSSLGTPIFIDDQALDEANPVVARLPGGDSVVVWAAPDGDERGIWMRRVAANGTLSNPILVNTMEDFGQFAPDVIWDGTKLVVAWVDDGDLSTGQDLHLATFSAALKPFGEQVLADTTATEANVALVPFAGSWAAAWRAGAEGLETIVVRAGSVTWSIGPFVPGASGDSPALAAIDSSHLLLAFSEGVSGEGSLAPPTNRLRVVVLNTGSPGAVDLMATSVLADTDANMQAAPGHPALVSAQGSLWASWRTAATPGEGLAEDLWLQPISWSAMAGLELSAPVIPLPRQPAHRLGDQRRPAMAAVESALVVVWEDLGRTFAPQGANREVVVELAPLPLLRIDEVTP